jgi:prevent-host-death family protein
MVRVSASEFAKNFGRYKEIARREPVEITSHNRPSGYLISEAEFAEFKRLKELQPRAISIYELSSEELKT